MAKSISKSTKLLLIIAISFSFFLAEIAVGFYTHSLALVADAFHYLNDLVGFIVAFVALRASQREDAPPQLSFGWQRATLLGAFFNGVFLLALGVSIFLQAIERFVAIQEIKQPKLVLIIGCIGLALNVVSVTILHEHDHDVDKAVDTDPEIQEPQIRMGGVEGNHSHEDHRHQTGGRMSENPKYDLGILGVLLHLGGDAINNVGVIVVGAVIWKTSSPARFYADPAIGVMIAIMIFISSLPLVKKSGMILLQSVPKGVSPVDVKHDMENVPGVIAVHELHIWRLNQQKSFASAHIIIDQPEMISSTKIINTINQCLHAYGIHSATLQPEFRSVDNAGSARAGNDGTVDASGMRASAKDCMVGCQTQDCAELSCCA